MRFLIFICLLHVSFLSRATDITPVNLRAEYKRNPFLDDRSPRLSWELVSKKHNQYQSAYQLIVASSAEKLRKGEGDIWDTGKVSSSQTNQIEYQGNDLRSRQQVWWKVRVWDADDEESPWSEVNFWEMGLLDDGDWEAKWIGYDLNDRAKPGKYHLPPSPYLRKETAITKKIQSARLYISSLGLHEFYVNGNIIGEDYFASGWTDYNKRVYYNVYDVTEHIKEGTNVFGAVLSDGWYAGYLGYAVLVGTKQVRGYYGDVPLLKAQVELTYDNGSRQVISTDADWKASTGAILESDFLQGETYDATQEKQGWNKTGFDDAGWDRVQVVSEKAGRAIQLYPGNPVQVINELPIKSIHRLKKGKYVVDFGQNFAGIIRLKIKGKPNDTLVFKYGEMLHPDGTLVTENLRSARATDMYVIRGDQEEEWSPRFTFHGFQFVEVSGLTDEPDDDFLVGLALSSNLETTGHLETDNSLLNQIYSNIVWTQRANYLDVPTDCPQRDERLGWTADAQVYIRSATYNNNIAVFHKKWIQDLNDAQWPNGAFPVYAPIPVNPSTGKAAIRASDTFSPGWSEAGIICTYEIFNTYNDTRIVRASLPYMVKFMNFLRTRADDDGLLREGSFDDISPKGGFGDWLSVGKKTSPDLLAAMYYFHCARLMEEMCTAIHETDLASTYRKLASSIKDAIMSHYMDNGGRFKVDAAYYGDGKGYVEGQNGFAGHTQTAYANAIYMRLLDEQDLRNAGGFLRELVEQNNDQLTTGFLGFKPLLPALSMTGSSDKAYKLLTSTEYPSLGYEVVNGATSIWERWDSYIKDKGFIHNAEMNSFSHYAFGAVNEWMFENMVGIKPIESGFRTFQIKPEIPTSDIELKKVNGTYHSIAGLIKSAWDYSGTEKRHSLEIPVNTTAYFYLESPSLDRVYLNGKSITKSELAQNIKQTDAGFNIKLGSGKYEITIKE